MSLIYKNRIEIPDSLARSIRAICIDRIGRYEPGTHTFIGVHFKPTQGRYEEIQEKMKLHEIDVDEVKGITNLVLQNNRTDASFSPVESISILGDNHLAPLTHIRVTESHYTTDLLYLGDGRFFVADTTRTTIVPDDILVSRGELNRGSHWKFDIIRKGKKFVDDIFTRQRTEAWFVSGQINQIVIFQSPEICDIIDDDEKWGGRLSVSFFSELGLWRVVDRIKSVLENAPIDHFENDDLFPEYEELLKLAKNNGIPSYAMNLIAQRIEKNEPHPYNFVKEDWEEHITEVEKERRRLREIEEKKKARINLEVSFAEAKKSIKVKKVLFGLFERDGAVANKEEMENIISALERTAQDADIQDVVKIHTPRMDYEDAKRHSQRNKKKNAINGIISGAIIFAVIFIAITWVLTKKGAEHFNEKVDSIPEMIQEAQYEEASTVLEEAYSNFSPSFMKVRVMLPHKRMRQEIEAAIDKDVQDGIEQIKTILKATRGRFDKNTEEMLFRLLQLRPENEELLELKEKWEKS